MIGNTDFFSLFFALKILEKHAARIHPRKAYTCLCESFRDGGIIGCFLVLPDFLSRFCVLLVSNRCFREYAIRTSHKSNSNAFSGRFYGTFNIL